MPPRLGAAPVFRQQTVHLAFGFEEKVLRGPLGDVQDLGDLPVFEALDLEQEKNRAPARVEPGERLLQREAQRMVGRAGARLRPLAALRLLLRLLPAALLPAHQVVATVDQDPVDPGRKRRPAPEAAAAPEDLQEGVLDDVFGIGDVAEEVERDAHHARTVIPVEPLERGQASASTPREELGIVRARQARLLQGFELLEYQPSKQCRLRNPFSQALRRLPAAERWKKGGGPA